MNCTLETTAVSDVCGLIRCAVFYRLVNQDDLACRESSVVGDWYLADWFREEDGELRFTPPAFDFRSGQLFGINGRHRAILLSRYMDPFPMILVPSFFEPRPNLGAIFERVVTDGTALELPDLPISRSEQ